MIQTEEPLRLGLGLLLITISIVCSAILVFKWIQCRKLRDRGRTDRTYPQIAMIVIAIAIYMLLIRLPVSIVLGTDWIVHDPEQLQHITYILLINHGLGIFCGYTFFVLALVRMWLMFYSIHFSSSIANIEWKKIISGNMTTLRKEQWFIAHRGDLGNIKYLLQWILGVVVVLSVININLLLLYLYDDNVDYEGWIVENVIFFIFATISVVIMYWKLPHFLDHFLVHRELQITAFNFVSMLVPYIINEFWFWFFVEDDSVWEEVHDALSFTLQIYGQFIISFVSAFWMLRHFKMRKGSLSVLPLSPMSAAESGHSVHSSVQSRSQSKERRNFSIFDRAIFKIPVNVTGILRDESFLNEFAEHLVGIYSRTFG